MAHANEKLAHCRLTVLELAERLSKVAEACRRGGIDVSVRSEPPVRRGRRRVEARVLA
jgi:hypothetical protein